MAQDQPRKFVKTLRTLPQLDEERPIGRRRPVPTKASAREFTADLRTLPRPDEETPSNRRRPASTKASAIEPTTDLTTLPRLDEGTPSSYRHSISSEASTVNSHPVTEELPAREGRETNSDERPTPNRKSPPSTEPSKNARAWRWCRWSLLVVLAPLFPIIASHVWTKYHASGPLPIQLRTHLDPKALWEIDESIKESSARVQKLRLEEGDGIDSTLSRLSAGIRASASKVPSLHDAVLQQIRDNPWLSTGTNCTLIDDWQTAHRPTLTVFSPVVDELNKMFGYCSSVTALFESELLHIHHQIRKSKKAISSNYIHALRFWGPNSEVDIGIQLERQTDQLEAAASHFGAHCESLWVQKIAFLRWDDAFQSFYRDLALNSTYQCTANPIRPIERRFLEAVRDAIGNEVRWEEFHSDYQKLVLH